MTISISVILPYFNGSRFVENAIRSVLDQSCPPLELIVVNDGSSQDESEFLDRFKRPGLAVINQPNSGVSVARNTGIKKAQGEWIAFIDQDDQWEPHKLEHQIAYLRENPDCRALHTAVKSIRQNGQEREYRKKPLSKADFLETFPSPAYLSSTLVEKTLLLEAGLFDPTLDYSQDCECFLRCAMIAPFHYLDEVLTLRVTHNSNLSGDNRGVWSDRVKIIRQYQPEFQNPAIFKATLYSMHGKFALLAIQKNNWKLLFDIVSEVSHDHFSRSAFLYNLARQRFSKAGH